MSIADMKVNEIAPIFLLTVILLIGLINDIRFRKIPNWLTYPAVLFRIVAYQYKVGGFSF
jgi:Flp pilus assembly protein protease CpaA